MRSSYFFSCTKERTSLPRPLLFNNAQLSFCLPELRLLLDTGFFVDYERAVRFSVVLLAQLSTPTLHLPARRHSCYALVSLILFHYTVTLVDIRILTLKYG